VVTKLRLRGIAEGVPEVRLARMLRRRRFAEAEAFATAFGLDKAALYEARAAWLLGKLSVWQQQPPRRDDAADEEEAAADDDDIDQLFAELTSTLGQIANLAYVVECCCLASLPSVHLTRQLLLFARQRLIEANGGGGGSCEVSQRQMLALGSTLHRLETFIMMGEGRRTEENQTAHVKVCRMVGYGNVFLNL
jgi:hypothetical protein